MMFCCDDQIGWWQVNSGGIDDFRALRAALAPYQLVNRSSGRSLTTIIYCSLVLLHSLGMACGPGGQASWLLHVVNVGMLILQVFSVQEYGNGSRSAAAGKSSVFWEMVFVCRKSPSRWWLYEYTSITAFPRSTKVVEVFGILSSRGGGGSIPSTVGGGICKNGGL